MNKDLRAEQVEAKKFKQQKAADEARQTKEVAHAVKQDLSPEPRTMVVLDITLGVFSFAGSPKAVDEYRQSMLEQYGSIERYFVLDITHQLTSFMEGLLNGRDFVRSCIDDEIIARPDPARLKARFPKLKDEHLELALKKWDREQFADLEYRNDHPDEVKEW